MYKLNIFYLFSREQEEKIDDNNNDGHETED